MYAENCIQGHAKLHTRGALYAVFCIHIPVPVSAWNVSMHERMRHAPHDAVQVTGPLARLLALPARAFAAESRPHSTASDANLAQHERTRLLIPDLAATAGQVSASRPMRAHIPSSDCVPRPAASAPRAANRPSRTDCERSGPRRSRSDRAAHRRTCADARASGRCPAPRLAAIRSS